MRPALKLPSFIPDAEAPRSKGREAPLLVGSLLSRRDSRMREARSAQPSRRVSDTLTARERDVLAMISQGFSNKSIARTLEISPETVKSHVKRIFLKLAVGTRAEAVSRFVSSRQGQATREVPL